MTTALYRRYRPDTFADVIGQEHVTEPLMRALQTGRVGHAYLFSGPRGCGKTTSARILARCLNCETGPTPQPCGTCDSCVALARGGPGSVDVIEIDAASHGGVDDARDLRERASYGPAQSRFKVYIIDEAHMVTTQGFNALLKIVEEPPEHVKFVFATTEPEKVIGTIRSRTHHYPFRLVPPAKLTHYLEALCRLEGVSVAPGVLGFVIRAGGGSVRDSLSVLDQLVAGSGDEGITYEGAAALLGFTSVELLDATVDAVAARDGAALFTVVDRVIESGHDPRRFAMDLLERLRDLIVLAAVPDGAAQVLRTVPADQLDRMRGQQSRFGPGTLSRAADIVNAGITEMTGATSPRLHLELICARILLPGASGEQGYAARLDRLERRLDATASPAPARAQPPSTPPSISRSSPPSTPPSISPASPPSTPPATSPPDRGDTDAAASTGSHRPTGDATARSDVAVSPSVSRGDTDAAASTGSHRPTGDATATSDVAVSPSVSRGDTDPQVSALSHRAADDVAPSGGGELDLAAVRRLWPDVLGRIFTMRRVTWTFLSQHAQVIEYDGSRLVLGIATTGLANTFRQGNHAEVVRQALIDAVALDVTVEGVPLPRNEPAPSEPRQAGRPARSDRGQAGRVARPDPGPTSSTDPTGPTTAPSDSPPEQPSPQRSTGIADSDAARHTGGGESQDPDELPSRDDEDVESGQAVIERMLGGKVLDESP
ncbi:MAG: DNA polymerase III subunit gamma and tau [Dermatophilaceae bacterium]